MAHLSIDEARRLATEGVEPLEAELVPLSSAAGRVLAEDVLADRDQPPFDRSAMDGYAIRSQDGAAGASLHVIGVLAAGAASDRAVGPGEALRIMTGAPVAAGADAVEMLENVSVDGEYVTMSRAVRARQNITARGEELRAGDVAVRRGAVVTSARLGVLWSVGAERVAVHRRPRVVILTTGDELVELGTQPGPTQIRDSNRASVGDLVARAGGVVTRTAIVRDDADATRAAVGQALDEADVLVVSGGVSAGDFDFVGDALEAEGVTKVFHNVEMKPGKPLWMGRRGRVLVFGLPGNPVSSFVTARVFLLPAIRRLGARPQLDDPRLRLPLAAPFGGTGSRPTFQPATIDWRGPTATLVKTHGSGDLRHFSEATTLALLPADHAPYAAGEPVEVLLDAEALAT